MELQKQNNTGIIHSSVAIVMHVWNFKRVFLKTVFLSMCTFSGDTRNRL